MEINPTFDQIPADRDRGPTLLIVDDQPRDRERAAKLIARTAHSEASHILEAGTIQEALEYLSSQPVHVVLLDKDLGEGVCGIDWIPEIISRQPHVQIIMVTGSNQMADIVRAVRLGALSYVTKETDPEYLVVQINTAVRMARNASFRIRAERTQPLNAAGTTLGGQSREFRTILSQARILAESMRPVLIRGATGTGKTEVARLIHQERLRFLKQPNRPFIELNIAAIAPELVEGELFGHDEGAYTSADSKRQGFIELANGGTLFLDEIGDASPAVQASLLKVIETGKFFRVGGEREMTSSFKLICATHVDLEERVRQKRFREDLFYRISTFPLMLPELEERREDIPDILRAILPKCCAANNLFVDFEDLPKDFVAHLTEHVPFGNIRGLQNQLERLIVFSPRDNRGRPIFSAWRRIPGLGERGRSAQPASRMALGIRDLLELPVRIDDSDMSSFPGLGSLLGGIEERLIRAARTRFSKNREIARWFRISDSAVSAKMKLLEKAESRPGGEGPGLVRVETPRSERKRERV